MPVGLVVPENIYIDTKIVIVGGPEAKISLKAFFAFSGEFFYI